MINSNYVSFLISLGFDFKVHTISGFYYESVFQWFQLLSSNPLLSIKISILSLFNPLHVRNSFKIKILLKSDVNTQILLNPHFYYNKTKRLYWLSFLRRKKTQINMIFYYIGIQNMHLQKTQYTKFISYRIENYVTLFLVLCISSFNFSLI